MLLPSSFQMAQCREPCITPSTPFLKCRWSLQLISSLKALFVSLIMCKKKRRKISPFCPGQSRSCLKSVQDRRIGMGEDEMLTFPFSSSRLLVDLACARTAGIVTHRTFYTCLPWYVITFFFTHTEGILLEDIVYHLSCLMSLFLSLLKTQAYTTSHLSHLLSIKKNRAGWQSCR